MTRFIMVALVLFSSSFALAHDHRINSLRLTDPASGEWCCNHIDCRAEKVKEVEGGYLTDAGDVVPFTRIHLEIAGWFLLAVSEPGDQQDTLPDRSSSQFLIQGPQDWL